MTVLLVHERMIVEQLAIELPADASPISQIRWALLHGEALTVADVTKRWGVSTTSLSMVAGDLVRAGFDVERERIPSPNGGPSAVRISIRNLDHAPQPFASRGTKTKTPAKRAKPAAAVEPAVPPKAGGRAPWADELARLRSFHRPAPAHPPVGTVVRVSMVAEDNGNAVIVLTDLDGARYFAHLDDAAT